MTKGNVLIKGAYVLDVHSGTYKQSDVLCRDGRIVEIDTSIRTNNDNVRVLRADGFFMTPGFIDGHVHVTAVDVDLGKNDVSSPYLIAARAARVMRGMLRRGFTTVRDVGGADHGLARAQELGLFEGPRLMYGGRALSQTGGHADFRTAGDDSLQTCRHGVGRVVDGTDQVRQAARDELRKGAHHIKIMASGGVASPTDRIDSTQFSLDEIRAVVEEAQAARRYVAAHAYTGPAVNRCLESGVRSIEHGNLLDARSIELLLQKDAFLVPNLAVYRHIRDSGNKYGHDADAQKKVSAVLERALESLQLAHEAGVSLVYGSDFLGEMHPRQNEEFRVRAEVQPVLSVVQAATINAARLIGRVGEIGELSVGAVADLLLFERNPLDDVNVLAEPGKYLRVVIQGGESVDDLK